MFFDQQIEALRETKPNWYLQRSIFHDRSPFIKPLSPTRCLLVLCAILWAATDDIGQKSGQSSVGFTQLLLCVYATLPVYGGVGPPGSPVRLMCTKASGGQEAPPIATVNKRSWVYKADGRGKLGHAGEVNGVFLPGNAYLGTPIGFRLNDDACSRATPAVGGESRLGTSVEKNGVVRRDAYSGPLAK